MAKVRLAILDDYQDIAPAKFSHLSSKVDVVSFPKTLNARDPEQKQQLIAQLQPFDIVSTMRERTAFPADVVNQLPNLKLLLTTGMRNASFDMDALTKRGVVVAGAKGFGKAGEKSAPTSLDSTMEHGWAMILGLARRLASSDVSIANGGWQTGAAFGLKAKTLGILGLGKLGADTARIGVAFGMKILAWSTSLTQEKADAEAEKMGLAKGVFKCASSKKELCETADILSVHYVLSDRSRGIVGAEELAQLKPSALVVNTSRGPLIDEEALLKTLEQGKIWGAALDVFDVEPLPASSPWRTTAWGKDGRSEVLLSPHMGYVEEDAMRRWYEDTAINVETWLEGRKLETQIN
ncbi:D-isomer specific 2-hydroxyacid dehydrogenase [Rhizodiscina lignyota]|uniref:D-isomer specific 2-hydroxyacid dehydrogenase n=1 Tax=Rhizodiscina lignyota TaxID=1504668 RepID=A0A9P4M3U3_9PEZI|nr:D-isomer specific 2-hydroxyacid dehydrogenase [Rhizodiscina lignyota]